ncbi:MAG: acyl-CoA dehydrogenase [Myxococcales bacterium]|nr:acyl-CoA dehydrogenase [Myxococcales bacterium]
MHLPGFSDRRDAEFLVQEVLDVGRLFKTKRFADHSWEGFSLIFDQAVKLAEEVIAPTLVDGDRRGVIFDDGKVSIPDSFKKALVKYAEGGWITLAEPEDAGGFDLPAALSVQCQGLFAGANVTFYTLPGLCHAAGELIRKVGTPEQIKRTVPKLYSGQWGGTMCLTEPGAGSDVGNLRTVAIPQPDGTYHLKGTKIFISWGEQDATENILYPVLARIEGDPAGSPGVSMFLVSKYMLDEKGRLGARNGVKCVGVEHKMGLHASATCTMAFGEDAPCVGELLGERCKGLRGMFVMMNTARIGVGLQGLGTAEAAYRYAHRYAIDRLQGSDVAHFKDPEAPRVPIIRHPDVRRMLLDVRGVVEGSRALLTYAAFQHDLARALEGRDAEVADQLLDLLTPLCKGYISEVTFEAVSTTITVLGGHGYLRDHPLEQYLRDMVIARLYEGTTGIQALDLVGRKLGARGGLALMELLGRMDRTVADARAAGLKGEADRMAEIRVKVGTAAMALVAAFQKGDLHGPLLQATPMLFLMGDAVFAWLHLWMATTAANVASPTTFHRNKMVTARHFIHAAHGRVLARTQAIADGDRAPLDMVFEGEAG